MNTFRLFLILSLSLCTSCFPSVDRISVDSIAKKFGAEKISISDVKYNVKNQNEDNTIKITLINPLEIKSDYSIEKTGSLVALLLYQEMKKSEITDYNKIKVIIEKDNISSDISFQASDLEDINKEFDTVFEYYRLAENQEFESINELIDKEKITKEIASGIISNTIQIDSMFGNEGQNKIVGFTINKQNSGREHVSIIWTISQLEEINFEYTFYIRRSNSKIVGLHINAL
jgi:hypothetical protein